jgi:hypothetical protein
MNYCCEVYASLYHNSCRWRDHGVWPHAGCQEYEQKSNIISRYATLLLEDPTVLRWDTVLKPKSDVCPFCNEKYDGYGPNSLDPWDDKTWLLLEDVPEDRARHAERHVYQTPDPEAGASFVRRLREANGIGNARS